MLKLPTEKKCFSLQKKINCSWTNNRFPFLLYFAKDRMVSLSCFDRSKEIFRCLLLWTCNGNHEVEIWRPSLSSAIHMNLYRSNEAKSDVECRSSCWYVPLNIGQKIYLGAVHLRSCWSTSHTGALLCELFTFIVTMSATRTKKCEQVMCNKMPLFTCAEKEVNSWQIKYRVYEVNVSTGGWRTKPSVNKLEQKVNTSTWNAIRKCTKRQRAKNTGNVRAKQAGTHANSTHERW